MRKGYSVVIKTIAVVFAVAMMLSLSACKPEENDFKAAQSVVSAMFDEIISGNGVSDANKYFSSADDIPREILDSMNFRKVFNDDGGEELIEEFKGIFGAEKAEEYVETIIDKALETVSYSIDSTKAEGRNVSVSVTLTYPDEENMVFDVMGDEDEAFREIFGVSDP
ncbi:MAG: hypothetical protein J1F64_06520, partial [Oscillospiraceae bacterium]|nr:hypothetical protein [Oscillospiraceae bacterium]